jgi:MFS family permease
MPVAGRLTDRFGSRGLGVGGILLALTGTLAFTTVGASTSPGLLAAALFTVGLGHGLVIPSLAAAPYQGLPKRSIPAATAMSNVAIRVATSFGVAVLALILQLRLWAEVPDGDGTLAGAAARGSETVGAVAHAFAGSFWWALAIGAVALVPAALLPRRAIQDAHRR